MVYKINTMSFTIVAKKFTIAEFDDYCDSIAKQAWVKKIVLHNTSSPSLAQRPGGILTSQHIKNLHSYYLGLGWSGGPHLFIDATGIWVFNPLNETGVHSPSYNSSAWGIEMLGEYSTESFTSGLGAAVANNAQHAMASLAKIQGWTEINSKMVLHKEDPKTSHKSCPGKNVVKADFMSKVNMILKPVEDEEEEKPALPPLSVVVNGVVINDAFVNEKSVTYAPLRAMCEALGLKVTYVASKNQVIVTKQ